MSVLENLQSISNNKELFEDYISNNFLEIYDFFRFRSHVNLSNLRHTINEYIRLNMNTIQELDAMNKVNLSFVSLLVDISEELGLIGSFQSLYKYLLVNNYNFGKRLEAASLYLVGVRTSDDYLSRYDAIYNHLQLSYEIEEDNTDKVLMTMVNYYAKVIYDFGEFNLPVVLDLRSKIENTILEAENSFLDCKIIQDVLKVNLNDFKNAYNEIHSLLDIFLGREIAKPLLDSNFIIEEDTEYSKLLNNVGQNFNEIYNISKNKYKFSYENSVVKSLGRGVAILTDEKQLYAYMGRYGDMHCSKLVEAFYVLPNNWFEKKISIVDWGCGQAIATMVYSDFLNLNKIQQNIDNVTLIDPSELSLKRASLHVGKIKPGVEIRTINKDFDSLVPQDFINNRFANYLHLFSNILDIDNFSLRNLLNLIELNFKGNNYFVCVGPYINDTKTSKINAFMNHFCKNDSFVMIDSIDNRSGEWKNSWTRVSRVFAVSL